MLRSDENLKRYKVDRQTEAAISLLTIIKCVSTDSIEKAAAMILPFPIIKVHKLATLSPSRKN
jgi:hypothetical protein